MGRELCVTYSQISRKMIVECFFATKTLTREMQYDRRVFLCYKNTHAREDYRKYSGSIPGRNQKFGDDHLVYVASGITSSRHIRRRTDQPSYREPGPLGCNFLTRECFIAKKHSTIILRKMIVECFFAINISSLPRRKARAKKTLY